MAAQITLSGPLRFREYSLPGGDAGIQKTIALMNGLVLGAEGVRNPQVRVKALEAAAAAPGLPRDRSAEIQAVLNWVKQHIQFRGEYSETLQSPLVTLHLGAGDCDDHAVLIAALLRSLGYQVRFTTITTDPRDHQFTHVFAEVLDRSSGRWLSLDSTVKGSSPGWKPTDVTRTKSYQTLGRSALGQLPAIEPGIAPTAPAGLSPTAAALYNIGTQFAAAAASRIAHGPTPQATGNLNLGLSAPTGSPLGTYILLGVGLFVFVMIIRRRQ